VKKIILIIWLHFISDFVFQTDYIAINKSKMANVLIGHCITYSALFIFFGWYYAFINGALHLVVDFVSSKLTASFWENNKRHWFFVTIGADQALHLTCLILTLNYLTR